MELSLPEKILQYLDKNDSADSLSLSGVFNEDSQKIVGAIKSLESLGDVICVEQFSKKQWELTAEGKQVAQHGSHEAMVYHAVPVEGILQSELMKKIPNAKVGFSKAMSAGWLVLEKSSGQAVVLRKVSEISDVVQQNLLVAQDGKADELNDQQKQEYKKRKLLQEVIVKGFNLKKGPGFSLSVSKPETDLTPEMIALGTWRTKQFKDYNLEALGVPPACGHLHPLLKVRAEFRQIFLEMGFSEMPTNNFVESSFWNFDALFQPQQHPARDAHDTFFLSEPKLSTNFPMEYLERVKKVHSQGGYGSQGYGYDWKIEEAQKNLLRTHTTAVSARMLYALSQKGFQPVKYFSIDRVFRNETLDATHLAEFHQVEGVVADYQLSLGDLIGTLYEFFKKLGIQKLYFKPAYNPYTEPSMEIFSYHEGLKKWMEVGNSGVFRPEMLLPMGLPENVNVIAWGLSLERPTMIKYGIDNIRDLVGPKVDLQMVQDCPICRLDKDSTSPVDDADETVVADLDNQWDALIERLHSLQHSVADVKSKFGLLQQGLSSTGHESIPENLEITIIADPQHPPYAVLALIQMMTEYMGINVAPHSHSTSKTPKQLTNVLNALKQQSTPSCNVRLIWKKVELGVELILSPLSHIKLIGEVTAVRYLSRLLESHCKELQLLENVTVECSTQLDHWMDKAHSQLINEPKKTLVLLQALDDQLKTQSYLVGNAISIADYCMFSVLARLNHKFTRNIDNWYQKCKTSKWISTFLLNI